MTIKPETLENFRKYVDSLKEPDKKGFYIIGLDRADNYSPRDLLSEMEKETEVGKQLAYLCEEVDRLTGKK